MKLFPDQIMPVDEAIKNLKRGLKVLLYAPTGAGKTVMASAIVEKLKPKKSIFLVNRQVLVSQSYETLIEFDLIPIVFHNTIKKTPFGVVMSDDIENSNVVISLVETLDNSEIDFNVDLIVIDEAHKSTSEMYQLLVQKYPNAMILGLSASPKRQQNKEGESLREWYDVMIVSKTVKELIAEKRLATPKYHNFSEDDHVVNTWLKMTSLDDNKRTIVFTSDTRHSLAVQKAFSEKGVTCEIITSGTTLDGVKEEVSCQTINQRNEIFRKFRSGDIDVLISVNALCEGFDEKLAKYCFILRKIGFVSLFHQICGRVLRIHPQKSEGHIVDFYDNLKTFGPIEEYVWDMNDEGSKEAVVVQNGDSIHYGNFVRKPKIFVTCEECSHVYNVSENDLCPCCEKKNFVTVTASFKQLQSFFFEKIDIECWDRFCRGKQINEKEKFWFFFEIVQRAIDKNMQTKFNEMYFPIFDGNDFSKEYVWMSSLVGTPKLKMTDKISFKL